MAPTAAGDPGPPGPSGILCFPELHSTRRALVLGPAGPGRRGVCPGLWVPSPPQQIPQSLASTGAHQEAGDLLLP